MTNRAVTFLRQLFVLPIRLYQGTISRWTPATCRFRPTCSQYAVEAVGLHGILKGGLLSTWRILRCNPFVKGGWDPVPELKLRNQEGCEPEEQ